MKSDAQKLWGGVVIGVAGLAVLIALGVWQVQRLAWKEAILAQIDARLTAAATPLPQTISADQNRWQSVALTGRFVGPDLPVLASRKGDGAGYRLIAAFETEAGRKILIDRGFVAEPALKGLPAPEGAAQITGNLHWPDEKDSYTPPPDTTRGIWFARELGPMAAALGTEPVLVVARSVTPPAPGVQPWPVDSSTIPNNHLQYAITWFGLAIVWAGMTLLFIRRNWRRNA